MSLALILILQYDPCSNPRLCAAPELLTDFSGKAPHPLPGQNPQPLILLMTEKLKHGDEEANAEL